MTPPEYNTGDRAFPNIRAQDLVSLSRCSGGGEITLRAPAKINLYLDICGRDARGYHMLNMVNKTVSLADTVTVRVRESERGATSFKCNIPGLPTDSRNTCVKAAELFRGCMELTDDIEITLDKRIPSEAGMGGGSADGAAVLLALDCLYGETLSEELLQTLSLAIGTDVPFCRLKRTAICTGDGSRVRFVRDNIPWENYRTVLIKPDAGISTAESYRTFDGITGGTDTRAPGAEKALAALADGDMEALGGAIYNSLMIPAEKLCPAVAEIAEYLREAGAVMAQMTGSGTCVFAFFDRQSGSDIGAVLDGARQRFGSGTFVYAEE